MVQQAPPEVGTVLDGYRFKGGDPASQDSWEQVEPIDVSAQYGAGARQLPNGVIERVGPRGGVQRIGSANGGDQSGASALVGADARARFMINLGPLQESQRILESMDEEGYNPSSLQNIGASALEAVPFDGGFAARIAGGPDYNAYNQAAKTFEAAILPIMSGAAVTPTEAQRMIRAALPQPGDSPEVLAQKARQRRQMINAVAQGIGEAAPYDMEAPEAPGAPDGAAPAPDGAVAGQGGAGGGIRPGQGVPANIARSYGEDGRVSTEEMLAAGWTPDYENGQWLPPGGSPGDPPPPAGPQGGPEAPQSEGYRTALEQERANADLVAKAGGGYDMTDALTGEFNDELAYGAGYLTQGLGNIGRRLTGRDIEVSATERGRAARDVMVQDRDRFARERPVQNFAGNVLGGAAFGPQGAARTMVGRMAQGGGIGATYGFAGAEGSVTDRLPSAGAGAAVGALATPLVERVAAPAINALARPIVGGVQSAGRFVGRQAGNVGNALGVPGAQRLSASLQPNPLQSGINRFAQRSPQQPDVMNDNALAMRAEQIQPTFADVVNDGGRGTLRALATRQTPARQAAREFADNRAAGLQDRVSLQARRTISDDPRQPREMRDEFVSRAREKAAPLYEEAYARPGAPRSPLTDELMERPSMREAMGRAVRIAREEGRDPNTLGFQFDADGNVLHVREPSMQTMDYLKRGLDDHLESFRDPVTNRLNLDTAGRAAQQTRVAFRSELERLNPVYGDALKAYGDEARFTDAVDIGERFLTMEADDFATAVARLSPEQQEIARAAARRAVERQAGTQGAAPGMAQRLANGREQSARTQALTGDAAPVQRAMRAELQGLRNAQGISPAQGSPTSMNAQDALGAAGAARDVATGNVVGLASRAMNAIRSRGFSDQEAEAIVQAAIDPAMTDQLVSMLAQRMSRRDARSLARALRYQITTNPPASQQ